MSYARLSLLSNMCEYGMRSKADRSQLMAIWQNQNNNPLSKISPLNSPKVREVKPAGEKNSLIERICETDTVNLESGVNWW